MAGNLLSNGRKMKTKLDHPIGKRILLIDDDLAVRDLVRQLLGLDGHIVVEANNGAEALSLFARNPFDFVLTDCRMPFVEGDELAVKIRQIAPGQRILMITGHAIRPGRTNPVDAVLEKPFDLADLRRALAELL
jgi:two-component system cell cycle response regulator CpdR